MWWRIPTVTIRFGSHGMQMLLTSREELMMILLQKRKRRRKRVLLSAPYRRPVCVRIVGKKFYILSNVADPWHFDAESDSSPDPAPPFYIFFSIATSRPTMLAVIIYFHVWPD
jgi:hypothetical protein